MRYTGRFNKKGLKLDNNFARNDSKSIRCMKHIGQIIVAEGAQASNNTRFVCHLDHWTTDWASIIENYKEFRFSKVQFVIEPRNVGTGAQEFTVAAQNIPYLAVRTVVPAETTETPLSLDKVRSTPGYRFVPIMRKKRTVVNAAPVVARLDTMVQPGSNATIQYTTKMPWMEITTDTKAYDFAAIEIVDPELQVQSGDYLSYDIKVYATVHLRGNTAGIVSPYL